MFSSLSEKQKEIVFSKSDKFVVRACPGSGKTYSVAARLANRIESWGHKRKGIAAMSFTNAAWQEIERQLKKSFNLSNAIQYPHFLGTIDSFISQYIFLPFGHLVMECQKRPVLVGEPYGSWNFCPYDKCYEQYFDIVSYNIDDSLVYPEIQKVFFFGYSKIINNNGTESGHAKNLRSVKQKFWQERYANQRDANYFAVKILEKYPAIAKALVARFPEFIIDEAQDTAEVQMRLIDILIENGLDKIMLIGDPDQAIFEWNNARPDLFNQKLNAWQENPDVLNENRRSSQKICDFTTKLTSMKEPAVAVNDEVKDCGLSPEIISYDHQNIDSVQKVVGLFVRKCKENDIETNPEKVSVLVRSGSLIDTVLGNQSSGRPVSPWVAGDAITRDLAKAKFLIDNNHYKEGYKQLEKAFVKAKLKKTQCLNEDIQARIDDIGFIQHRKEIYEIASHLPSTEDINVDAWVIDANRALNYTGLKLNIKNNGSILLRRLFQKESHILTPDEYRLGTVHSVKGETFDAVLLLLKTAGADRKKYTKLLADSVKTKDNEELRIVYVAMTRPRKFLMIAVPSNCAESWYNFFDNFPDQDNHG